MPKNPDFGTFGRYRSFFVKDEPQSEKGYEYTLKERGQVPGHYKSVQNPKLSRSWALGAYSTAHHRCPGRDQIATNLTNSNWLRVTRTMNTKLWRAGRRYDNQTKVRRCIVAAHILRGAARSKWPYEVNFARLGPCRTPGLYRRAVSLLGMRADRLTVLVGYFPCVRSSSAPTTSRFSSATGLER